MPQVRRYQRGSVLKRGKMWYGIWRVDVKSAEGTSTRRQQFVRLGTFAELPTKTSARDKLSQVMDISHQPSMDMTLDELFARWQGAVVPTKKDSTAFLYEYNVKKYVLPLFGNRQISKISRYDVELFLASQAKSGYCRDTIRTMRSAFRVVMSWAVKHGWVADNPCFKVELPVAGSRVVRTVLGIQQISAIAAELDEPYATLLLFLAITGVRIGEAVAIKWADFRGDELSITRRLYRGKIGPTKTRKSERGMPIPEIVLKRMRASCGQGEWVFRCKGDMPLNPGNVLRRHVRPVAKHLGIHIGGWHDFRHTVATKMLRGGLSPRVVADLLGNSVEMLLKVYDHTEIENFRQPLAERANQLLADVSNTASGA